MLYECLTGQQPYPGTSAEQQLAGHLSAPPPRPSLTQPGVPPAFDAVIATGMAKDPNQRYQTTLELAKAARAALTAPTTPIPQPTAPEATASPPAPTGPPIFGPEAPTAVHAGAPPPAPAHNAPTQYAPMPPSAPPPVVKPSAPQRRWSRRTVLLAAAAAVAVVAAGIIVGITLTHSSSQTPTPSAGPPDTPKPKPAGPLDGTFTAAFGPKTDPFGAPYSGNLVSGPHDGTWSIRSACLATGCVATASFGRQNTKLSTLVFDDIDGRWTAVAVTTGNCSNMDTDVWAIFTLQPQPDGTLSGEYIEVPQIQCGAAGVPGSSLPAKQTLKFTRTGDVDPNVQVADPETQPARVLSRAQGLHGQYRDTMQETTGTFTLDHTVRTYCLRTGDRCISLAYNAHDFLPLVFADGKWTVNYERDAICESGGTVHYRDTREFPLPLPPQDPIPLLTGHGRQEITGGTSCDGVHDFDEKFERTGDQSQPR